MLKVQHLNISQTLWQLSAVQEGLLCALALVAEYDTKKKTEPLSPPILLGVQKQCTLTPNRLPVQNQCTLTPNRLPAETMHSDPQQTARPETMHSDPQQTARPETMHFDPQDWGSKTASASSTSVTFPTSQCHEGCYF